MLGNFFFLFFFPKKTAKRTEIKGHGRKNKEEFIGGTKKKKKRKEITLRRLRYVKIQFVSFKKERVCQA